MKYVSNETGLCCTWNDTVLERVPHPSSKNTVQYFQTPGTELISWSHSNSSKSSISHPHEKENSSCRDNETYSFPDTRQTLKSQSCTIQQFSSQWQTAYMTVVPYHYNGAKTFLLLSDIVAVVMSWHNALLTYLWWCWCKQIRCTVRHIKV